MERYIGLDVHCASTTMAVVGPSGRRIGSQVLETNGKALVKALESIAGRRHVCLEEGAQAEWLYQVLKPHTDELVVAKIEGSSGPKSDARDAFALAELLRKGGIGTPVFKDVGKLAALRELCRLSVMITGDVVRTKNRIKSVYRSRGVQTPDASVYSPSKREAWLKTLPKPKRVVIDKLYEELDMQVALKAQADEELVAESRKFPAAKLIESCPGFGPIRTAQFMAIVVTPDRFRTRSQFWAYCGLAVVTRSSSDWVRDRQDRWVRATVQTTRGLNVNHNPILKSLVKGAATTVIAQKRSPLSESYETQLANGTKPNLAKLTLARRLASIALAVWRNGTSYDSTHHRKSKATPAS